MQSRGKPHCADEPFLLNAGPGTFQGSTEKLSKEIGGKRADRLPAGTALMAKIAAQRWQLGAFRRPLRAFEVARGRDCAGR